MTIIINILEFSDKLLPARTADNIKANGRTGIAEKISVTRIKSISTHPPKYPDKQPTNIAITVDIITATAPIVIVPPTPDVRAMPHARFFVFLGRAALARCMPGTRGEENRWLKSPGGRDVLLVKSPEEIVRFTTVTPALKRMKQEMWLALKTVMQRVRIGN